MAPFLCLYSSCGEDMVCSLVLNTLEVLWGYILLGLLSCFPFPTKYTFYSSKLSVSRQLQRVAGSVSVLFFAFLFRISWFKFMLLACFLLEKPLSKFIAISEIYCCFFTWKICLFSKQWNIWVIFEIGASFYKMWNVSNEIIDLPLILYSLVNFI